MTTIEFSLTATAGEKYGPAMKITDPAEAEAYLAALVRYNVAAHVAKGETITPERALEIELSNLGYVAGYYDTETRQRVQKLYGAIHPIFGPLPEPAP